MTERDYVQNDYFEWMYDLVCGGRHSENISYRKLLTRLHDIVFRYSIPMDANRAENGKHLRHRYALRHRVDERDLDIGECTILEMMVALAIRCEEEIMDDPDIGDRTAQWFWGMIVSLGLGSMTDDVYDRDEVDYILQRFMSRDYEPDGRGGLFRIRNCRTDLRDVEIWHQMLWYLNSIV